MEAWLRGGVTEEEGTEGGGVVGFLVKSFLVVVGFVVVVVDVVVGLVVVEEAVVVGFLVGSFLVDDTEE